MSRFGIGDKDLAENLFTLCLQADASFEHHFIDAIRSANIPVNLNPEVIDHREIFFGLVSPSSGG